MKLATKFQTVCGIKYALRNKQTEIISGMFVPGVLLIEVDDFFFSNL